MRWGKDSLLCAGSSHRIWPHSVIEKLRCGFLLRKGWQLSHHQHHHASKSGCTRAEVRGRDAS